MQHALLQKASTWSGSSFKPACPMVKDLNPLGLKSGQIDLTGLYSLYRASCYCLPLWLPHTGLGSLEWPLSWASWKAPTCQSQTRNPADQGEWSAPSSPALLGWQASCSHSSPAAYTGRTAPQPLAACLQAGSRGWLLAHGRGRANADSQKGARRPARRTRS